jgi:hypothetical protein
VYARNELLTIRLTVSHFSPRYRQLHLRWLEHNPTKIQVAPKVDLLEQVPQFIRDGGGWLRDECPSDQALSLAEFTTIES